ncbi:MAG TPA: bifunctional diaminohydroxyphosphoribosylaminopyrimidine deaminase/5-amino-6-(5-phosphoribosylamino)uracil reductase RibD [Bacteroidota bacterium]|nr:bifunctional diaminohydroxyphosphoribosylaminopyrimidine deaminase/5-amino-6-(5-phosphoribosylamino)uracil reductase RibD [Bacteroidota bacterium]
MKTGTEAAFMKECLDLAEKGRGKVSPNPLVGAVVVKNGRIIGRGYHRRFGGAHAEVEAMRSCRTTLRGATLYVNLEPCCHHGKTPPCTELIRASGISRVVIGMRDPNPLVAGKGIRTLRRAGIPVRSGVLHAECGRLNEAFTKHVTTGMPLVTLKIAQTLDGMVSDRDGNSRWITGDPARIDAHRRRSQSDCILVGAGTVTNDDPLLTVRHVTGPQPIRAILDGNFTARAGAKLFRRRGKAPTVLITTERAFLRHGRKAKAMAKKGVMFMVFPGGRSGVIPPGEILSALGRRGITSVLIEGGPGTWGSFLNARCADRVVIYTSPSLLGGERRVFRSLKPSVLSHRLQLKNVSAGKIGEDILTEGDIVHTLKMR